MTVRADAVTSELRLLVAGCVTEQSYPDLLPLMRRARAMAQFRITIDLSGADHIDSTGLLLLRKDTDRLEDELLIEPVELVVPDRLPSCLAVTPVEEGDRP
ncbi:hypothetical protein [Brachybacterium sp. YJGR34]|uniref:hypothetical protein n=1 Tax=Brachybacterium sp. YJGR34 TaxID=2059911 RepID=UPI000E0B61F2|nr:hypothetical protein [Brachybacterium sp. YJGR34]